LGDELILKLEISLFVSEFNFRILIRAFEKNEDFPLRRSMISDSVASWNLETNKDLFLGIILRLPTNVADLTEEEDGIEEEFVSDDFLLLRGEIEVLNEVRHAL